MRVRSVDCQGVGFIALSVARRKYGLSRHPASRDTRTSMCSVPVDSRPASLMATATERAINPTPLVSVAVLESAVLAMALPKVTQLLVRSSKKLSQFTAEIKGMVLGFAPVTVASRDAGPELTRTYSQRVTGADPRTMLPPLPTHTKPKQDSSHA